MFEMMSMVDGTGLHLQEVGRLELRVAQDLVALFGAPVPLALIQFDLDASVLDQFVVSCELHPT